MLVDIVRVPRTRKIKRNRSGHGAVIKKIEWRTRVRPSKAELDCSARSSIFTEFQKIARLLGNRPAAFLFFVFFVESQLFFRLDARPSVELHSFLLLGRVFFVVFYSRRFSFLRYNQRSASDKPTAECIHEHRV